MNNQLSVNGLSHSIFPIQNESHLLVLSDEIDQDSNTRDSTLSVIDISTGQVDATASIDNWTSDMVIDSTETYAYVFAGIRSQKYLNNNRLLKYTLPDLNLILDESIVIGCHDLEISHDDSKLYLHDQIKRALWIVDADDFSIISDNALELFLHYDFNLLMGYDNRLFVSVDSPIAGEDDPAIYVFDTINDELITELTFNQMGIDEMAINPVTGKLYGLVGTRTYYPPDRDSGPFYEATNKILELNLDDYSHQIITLGDDPLWEIAVAYENGLNRLFCRVVESNVIKYKDL